jgi:predicted SprT family Zn-dependent metalloprotease
MDFIKNSTSIIREHAIKLMNEYGLEDWTFQFCNGKQLHGKANLTSKIISISRIHAIYEQNFNAINDTILHEISHAIDFKNRGYSNHDKHWKQIAREVGCVPSSRGYGKSTVPFTKKQMSKYIGICPNCNKNYYRNRRLKVACRNCCNNFNNGKFSKRFILIYKPNEDYIQL